MTSRQHTHRSAFFWDSKLTDERKDELIAWVKSQSDEDADKLEDLLHDVRDDQRYSDDMEGDLFGGTQ